MKTISGLLFVLLLTLACQNESKQSSIQDMSRQMLESDESYQAEGMQDEVSQPVSNAPNYAPKIIKRADLRMQVKSCEKTKKALALLITNQGASVSNEEETRLYDRLQVVSSIKVQPQKLDFFILLIEELALQVEEKHVSADDVSQQYVDIESRLKNRKAVIEQYRQLLKSAKSVTDVLLVEEKLNSAIEEVESAEAQLQTLQGQIQFSSVRLTYYELLDTPNIQKKNFGSRFSNALRNGWLFLQHLVIWVVSTWPLWIILGGAGFWLYSRRKRK